MLAAASGEWARVQRTHLEAVVRRICSAPNGADADPTSARLRTAETSRRAGATLPGMPRYMIERDFGAISDEEMLAAAVRSDQTAQERFPDITWEHSHVCVSPEGTITTFCVYSAPSEDVVRDHANAFGGHVVTKLHEIAEDVTPELIRQRAESGS